MQQKIDRLSILNYVKPKIKPTYNTSENEYDGMFTTLASLRKKLQAYYFYPNILKYHNIASDLMVINGIKELIKILIEIKDVFCANNSYRKITVVDINVMRSRLFITTLFFEEFIRNLFEKLRYDASYYSHVI